MDTIRHQFGTQQSPHLPSHTAQHLPSGRTETPRSRGEYNVYKTSGSFQKNTMPYFNSDFFHPGGDKLWHSPRPQIQPSDGDVPPMARLTAGLRSQFFMPGGCRLLRASDDAFSRGQYFLLPFIPICFMLLINSVVF